MTASTQRVLVTGATAGIGWETARQLAAQGRSVWVHGRSESSADAAVAAIRAAHPKAQLESVWADLSSLAETRALARQLTEFELDVVVHNAGVWMRQPVTTGDGHETTWAVNHLAPFLLTAHLLDGLLARPEARVITVSSMGHRSGRIHFPDPNLVGRFDGLTAYCQSKLANVLFTQELARRTAGTSLVATSLHPGMVQTKLLACTGFGTPAAEAPATGARTSVYLATAPASETPSGDYFVDSRRASASTRDEGLARRLWALSEQHCAAFLPTRA